MPKKQVRDSMRTELLKQIRTYEDARARYRRGETAAAKASRIRTGLIYGIQTRPKLNEPPTDPSSYLREVLRTPERG